MIIIHTHWVIVRDWKEELNGIWCIIINQNRFNIINHLWMTWIVYFKLFLNKSHCYVMRNVVKQNNYWLKLKQEIYTEHINTKITMPPKYHYFGDVIKWEYVESNIWCWKFVWLHHQNIAKHIQMERAINNYWPCQVAANGVYIVLINPFNDSIW